MDEERFSKQVVEVIAKRAANICSNPDCGAITTGPAEEADRSVVIGEAAHIYGARPGSARYSDALSPAERGDITNAIWLCRNCHKAVDGDASGFPADLLFEWKRQHHEEIAKKLGKPSELARDKIIARRLSAFQSCSYLAQQIVIDKPDAWEYKLTAELMRSRMGPVLNRNNALARGAYTKSSIIVPKEFHYSWFSARMDEIQRIVGAFSVLVNDELQTSWGEQGQPGNAAEILRVCDLFVECAEQIVCWEEAVRFSVLPDAFDDVQSLLSGSTAQLVEQLARIPEEISAIFSLANPQGEYRISLTLSLPDGWAEKMQKAIAVAAERLRQ